MATTQYSWMNQCKAVYTPPPDRALTDAQALANAQIPPWNSPPVIYKPTPATTGWLVKPYQFPLQAPNSGPQSPPMGPFGPSAPPEPPPPAGPTITQGLAASYPANTNIVVPFAATGGTPPYTWSIENKNPDTGEYFGFGPDNYHLYVWTEPGTWTITVVVTDSAGESTTQLYTVTFA